DFRINGRFSGQLQFPLTGSQTHRPDEASRPGSCKELLRIGAWLWRTGRRELHVELGVDAACETVSSTCGAGLAGVENLVNLCHRTLLWFVAAATLLMERCVKDQRLRNVSEFARNVSQCNRALGRHVFIHSFTSGRAGLLPPPVLPPVGCAAQSNRRSWRQVAERSRAQDPCPRFPGCEIAPAGRRVAWQLPACRLVFP